MFRNILGFSIFSDLHIHISYKAHDKGTSAANAKLMLNILPTFSYILENIFNCAHVFASLGKKQITVKISFNFLEKIEFHFVQIFAATASIFSVQYRIRSGKVSIPFKTCLFWI